MAAVSSISPTFRLPSTKKPSSSSNLTTTTTTTTTTTSCSFLNPPFSSSSSRRISCSSLKSPPLHYTSLRHSLSSSSSPTTSPPTKNKRMSVKMMSVDAGIGVMGTKLGMMTYFEPVGGKVVPVTVVGFREGNIVTQIKTQATDGYDAVQIGYRRVRDKKLKKPEMGHLDKIGAVPLRHLQEFRLVDVQGFEANQKLVVEEIFKEGDLVDVSGTTIGKGFQGGIKRWNFKRGQMTHGSKSHRQLGSIGAGTTPGHVYKGKKMPGRMGGTKTKIRKLPIIKIDNDLRIIMIKGALPGKPGNLLRIAPAKIVGLNIPKN